MTRKPVPQPPLAPLRGAAPPLQAQRSRPYPPPPVAPFRGQAPAAQAKATPPAPWRRGAAGPELVIQLAAPLKENKATASAQATYLTATNMTTEQLLCENLASAGGAHSEDLLIDKVLPWAADNGKLAAGIDNVLYVGINRSPCTSTDHKGNGKPSCNKGVGKTGCAERLIALVGGGFTHKGKAYPIKLVLEVRNLYGSDSDEEANSASAIEAMVATGRISCDTQRIATSVKFLGSATAKKM